MTFIKYFIPEDGDEQNHPNVYSLDSSQPKLFEIKKSFPISGEYHFRFLKNVAELVVWMDVLDDSCVVPSFQGSIFAKVSRITTPKYPPMTEHSNKLSSKAHDVIKENITSESKSNKTSEEETRRSLQRATSSLLKFDDEAEQTSVSGNQFDNSNDLLGLSRTPSVKETTPTINQIDLFGLDSLQPVSPSQPPPAARSSVSPINVRGKSVMASGAGPQRSGGFDVFEGLDSRQGQPGQQGLRGPGGTFGQKQPPFGQFPPQQQQQQQPMNRRQF